MPSKKSTLKNKNRCFRRKYRSTRRRGGSFGRGRPVYECPKCHQNFASAERFYSHCEEMHPEMLVAEEEPVIQPPPPQPAPAPAANQLDAAAAPIAAAFPRPRGRPRRPPGASAAPGAAASPPMPRNRSPSADVDAAPPPPSRRGRPSFAASAARHSASIVRALPPPSEATAAIEAEAAAHHARRGRPAVVRGLAVDTTLAEPRTIPDNIIRLKSSASCFDFIEGNEPVIRDFLNESRDNLVIFYRPPGQREFFAVCYTFTQLRMILKDGTYFFFQCIDGKSYESYARDAEAQRGPHFLKIATPGATVFVDYKQMKQKYIERQNMIFLDFDRVIPRTISYNMSAEMNQVGSSHCQDGSDIAVYNIII